MRFKGKAKRLDDIDIPRIGYEIGVGEDELHAFMDVEAAGSGFDKNDRPKMLFEPHVFYRNLKGEQRDRAVNEGLAYFKWRTGRYPKDSYPRLLKAIKINQTAALKASSWGLSQILGENHLKAGFTTPDAMVHDFMQDEENQLQATVNLIVEFGIDDELRILADPKSTDAQRLAACHVVARVWNGRGYKRNDYANKLFRAHNKWRKIPDTPWTPKDDIAVALVVGGVMTSATVVVTWWDYIKSFVGGLVQ